MSPLGDYPVGAAVAGIALGAAAMQVVLRLKNAKVDYLRARQIGFHRDMNRSRHSQTARQSVPV